MDIKIIEDAVEELVDLYRQELTSKKSEIQRALQNVAGENEGDTSTVSIGSTGSIIETQGTEGLEVSVKGSFIVTKATFASDRIHVGGPEDGVGDTELGLPPGDA